MGWFDGADDHRASYVRTAAHSPWGSRRTSADAPQCSIIRQRHCCELCELHRVVDCAICFCCWQMQHKVDHESDSRLTQHEHTTKTLLQLDSLR